VADYSANLTRPLPLNGALAERAVRGLISYETIGAPGVGRLRAIYMPVVRAPFEPFVVVVAVPVEFVGAEVGTLARR
ncbi:hypothetical protein, partial [Vibrio alginolyticus]|uniref:hypothetical protein n=1 Tax=Vibrio alginolyticus TaxID=663 RepID=UPI001A8D6340